MLLFGLARPADSIVFGNNLLTVQVTTAAALAAMMVLGIYWLDGRLGLKGVALVLLLTEVVNASTLLYWASRWLRERSMQWPRQLFFLALVEVMLSAVGILLVATLPAWRAEITLCVFAGTALVLGRFLSCLPAQQRSWLRQKVCRFVPQLRED
jgi:hypothetical protein